MVMLLRCTTIPYEWASVCNLFIPSSSATDSPGHDAREATTLPGVRCNWSTPVPTNIPDAHTRTHAGTRPWNSGHQEQFLGSKKYLSDESSVLNIPWAPDNILGAKSRA